MRGFTGHEQFDDVGRVHMNGRRVYDPLLEARRVHFHDAGVNGAITLGTLCICTKRPIEFC